MSSLSRPAVSTDEISDPTWHDLFDRDDVIRKLQFAVTLLEGEVARLREQNAAKDAKINSLIAVLS
jgi:hypothetical protein